MSNELTATYRNLLSKIASFMEKHGVREGIMEDGELLKEIKEALSTGEIDILSNPNIKTGCPLCDNPSALDCDCPPDQQMAAMQNM